MTKNLLKTPDHWLTLEDCENLLIDFLDILSKEEPLPSFNTRFPEKLEGILGSVPQTYSGSYLNDTVLKASASYFNQFIRGHAFENGNKRCAVLFTQWFLLMNSVTFTLSPYEMYNFAIVIAQAGEKGIDAEKTKKWIIDIFEKYTKNI